MAMEDDWGGVRIDLCKTCAEFWGIIDDVMDGVKSEDSFSEFFFIRNTMLDSYKENRLYMAYMIETEWMYLNADRDDSRFVKSGGLWQLRAFCTLSKDNIHKIEFIWVHPSSRRKGLGTHFVKQLDITSTTRQLEDAHSFWEKMGLTDTK